MICDKCDPAGHVAGEEREFLARMYDARRTQLQELAATLNAMLAGSRPFERFTGQRIAEVMRDIDAIQNLQIVVGII